MADIYIVVGARGVVGEQVVSRLESIEKSVLTISGKTLVQMSEREFLHASSQQIKEISTSPNAIDSVGVILAHRTRHNDVSKSVQGELRLCRDLIRAFAEKFSKVNVVILGSITGSFIDIATSEAYHYAKDTQKSCVRQSIRIPNLCMNLIELSWFVKYPEHRFHEGYRKQIEQVGQRVGYGNLPTVLDITDFAVSLIELRRPPRGQVIAYDGGYSLLQE